MPEDEGTHAAADGVDSLWRSLGLPDRLHSAIVLSPRTRDRCSSLA